MDCPKILFIKFYPTRVDLLNVFLMGLLTGLLARYPVMISHDSFLGKISYEIYLTHYKILIIATALCNGIPVYVFLPVIICVGTLFM